MLGADVTIGAGSRLSARVTVLDGVRIGERCIVHPGAVIGADGFGFAPNRGAWVKVPQLGSVAIGNDVEIGANTTIDRGTIDDTVIEDGVKLDNLVQIAHNVRLGEHTIMAAMSGVAGSTKVGKRCMIGGGVVMINQLTICDDVMFTFRSVVTRSVDRAGYVFRQPAGRGGRAVASERRALQELGCPRGSTTGGRAAAEAAATATRNHLTMSDEMPLDIKAILERLPHRYPFLMVDRVLSSRRANRSSQ